MFARHSRRVAHDGSGDGADPSGPVPPSGAPGAPFQQKPAICVVAAAQSAQLAHATEVPSLARNEQLAPSALVHARYERPGDRGHATSAEQPSPEAGAGVDEQARKTPESAKKSANAKGQGRSVMPLGAAPAANVAAYF